MKLFIFSDIHFREYSPFVNYNSITESGYTREIENFLRGCQFLATSIKETKPDIVFNLGDTIHLPTVISLKLNKALDEGLGWIEESCKSLSIPLFHLIGNHDIFSEESNIDFSPFFNHRYGTCYNSHQIENFKDETFNIVPYTSDMNFMYSEFSKSKGFITLTHAEFKGAQYENNQYSPTILENRSSDVIISGHIHKPQEAGGVIYVGSLISMKFDHIDPRLNIGAMLFDTETRAITRLQNNLSSHYIKLYSSQEIKNLPGKNFIIKLYTRESKRDIEDLFSQYEILYTRQPEKSSGERTTIVNAKSSKDSLRDYIESENPDALDIFDRYTSKGGDQEL